MLVPSVKPATQVVAAAPRRLIINGRRQMAGLPSIVSPTAIEEFKGAVTFNLRNNYMEDDYPIGSNGNDQHAWGEVDREKYKVALSELNAEALASLPPSTVAELKKLFEMTTVTKKLRRIAGLSYHELARASMLIRPTSIAITFMNYRFPEYWYRTPEKLDDAMVTYINDISKTCRAPVDILSFGPDVEHTMLIPSQFAKPQSMIEADRGISR